jgi:hypothetical protein
MDDFSRELFTQNYLSAIDLTERRRACDVARNDYELMVDVLVNVLKEATDTAFPRDSWKTVTAFDRPTHAACVFRQTVKSQMEVELVIEPGEVSLRYGLAHVWALPRMTDRFWTELLALFQNCSPKYSMSSWPLGFASNSWDKHLSKQRKSIVFSIIADFILTTQADRESHPAGDFEFRFRLEPWNILIPKLRGVIRSGAALSYMLYRSNEQWRQQVIRRAKRRSQILPEND